MHQALKLFRYHGVRVIEATTGIDLTDRMGKIVATVQGLNAEVFLERLREETRRGMKGAISRGLSAGGRTFGYRSEPIYDPVKKDAYGNPVIVGARRVIYDREAKDVVYIFTLYADEGLTPRAIAHRLNREGVTPRRTARGRWGLSTTRSTSASWSGTAAGRCGTPDTGRRVVRARPVEEWIWKEAPELRVVPQDLWDRVQARRKQRRFTVTGQTGGPRPRYLLSGLMICAECGGRYVIQ